ncbi:MAG: peptidylprolyl isomerase [Anaerolineae bacterium]|nr:peptidylprolyl isomerase [Anaerolineae bacterium]
MLKTHRGVRISLVPGMLVIALAACGSPTEETATPAGRLPRGDRISARDIEVVSGLDICDGFISPTLQPFKPEAASPLYIMPNEHVRGAQDAAVTIIEYGDFTCKECAGLAPGLKALLETYSDLKIVFRHLPLGTNARIAAIATEIAYDQKGDEGFWAMHDLLYEKQSEWEPLSEKSLRYELGKYADEIGLDGEQMKSALDGEEYSTVMDFAVSGAESIGVTTVPSLYVNDLLINELSGDEQTLDLLVQITRIKQTYREAPPMVIDPAKTYAAWIFAEQGTMAVDLYAELAPETVNNFAYLACTGYYDDITWHRVIPGFVAQTGDPTGTGFGGPLYTIPDEFEESGLTFNQAGWLSMAHSTAPDSAGSQFFITLGPAEQLNGSFTIFGKVVSGLEIAQSLRARDPQTDIEPGDPLMKVVVRELE